MFIIHYLSLFYFYLSSLKMIIAWLLSFISYITFIACPRETVLNVVFALLIFYPGFSHVLHTQRTGGSLYIIYSYQLFIVTSCLLLSNVYCCQMFIVTNCLLFACPRETVLNVVFALFNILSRVYLCFAYPKNWWQPGPWPADPAINTHDFLETARAMARRLYKVEHTQITGVNPDHGLPTHYLFFILVLVVF